MAKSKFARPSVSKVSARPRSLCDCLCGSQGGAGGGSGAKAVAQVAKKK